MTQKGGSIGIDVIILSATFLFHEVLIDGLRWNSSYIVRTASPPTLGKCDVEPTEGVFLQDMFSVNCSGFGDKSNPLTYMFYMDPGNESTSKHGEAVEDII